MNIRVTFISVFLLLSCSVNSALADKVAVEQDIQEYISIFEHGDDLQISTALNNLHWSGISDERIWDYVAKEVEAGMSKTDISSVKHLAKRINALALSGNSKYEPVIKRVIDQAASKKYSQYAEKARRALADYVIWNPIISKDIENAPIGKLNEWRVVNMLESSHAELIRTGAKRIYYAFYKNKDLSDLAEKILLDKYRAKNDRTLTDALVWLCRALGETGETAYKSTLIKVSKGAANSKLRSRAAKYSKVL